MKPYFSVIVPIYNEEGNLQPLTKRIQKVMSKLKKPWELILVNDGSTDNSERLLRRLANQQSHLKVINLTRNFGQTAGLAAGFDHAQGKILITLDADLQNDPDDIPRLLKLMKQKKADIVAGWRKRRSDPFLRSITSVLANKIINRLMGSQFHDLGCTLRVYKKESLSYLGLYGEMHRFIPILAAAQGAKIVETSVSHHPRRFGQSKYGLTRTFKVLLDLITLKFLTGFQTKPIYMFGFAGIFFIFLSVLGALYVIGKKIIFGSVGYSPVLFSVVILFNAGVMCALMGLLAEIQIRTWYESSNRKGYLIKDIFSHPAGKAKQRHLSKQKKSRS